jgi:hypothetical protein
MRVFLGLILGVVLTISGAYVLDSYNTAPAVTAPPSAEVQRPMVNWDVVGHNWQAFKSRVQDEWTRLSSSMKA